MSETPEAEIRREPELKVVQRRKLFTGKFLNIYSWVWDVAPDGRFLMDTLEEGGYVRVRGTVESFRGQIPIIGDIMR